MSRVVRLVALTGALLLGLASALLLGADPARAEESVRTPSNSGYFYVGGVDKPEQSPQDVPNVGDQTDGVAPTHLPVAATGGEENKVSFLYFDVFDLPEGTVIDKAVLTMVPLPNTPPTDISYQAAPEKVAACMAGDEGFAGDDGEPLSKAPSRLCDKFQTIGKAGPGGTYEFDVTALAASWLSGTNEGIALTPADRTQSSNFQVVFDSAPGNSLKLSYTLPQGQEPEVPVAPPLAPVDTGTGTALPPVDTGGGLVSGPPIGSGGPVAVPPAVVPQPQTPAGGTPVATTNAGSVSAPMRPTNAFWLGGLALLATLLLVSLVAGDPRPQPAQQSTTRLTKALATRRLQPL